MTALCAGGGPSQPKSGYDRLLFMAPATVGAFLNNIPTVWAVALAAYIGSITYDLSTFCTTDPPALPTFTEDDIVAVFNPADVVNWIPARQKVQDLVGYFLWFQVCECVTGAQPAPAAPPAAPAGAPLINPPSVAPTYPTGTPCAAGAFDDVYTPPTAVAIQSPLTPLPTGATYAILDATWNGGDLTNPSAQTSLVLTWRNAADAVLGSIGVGINSVAATPHFEAAITAGATHYRTQRDLRNMATRAELWSSFQLLCGDAGGGGAVPQPCPPDPIVQGMLDQILQLVTLIQRQAVPFAYVASTVHAGLTGNGEIAVQGLIGVRVLITDSGGGLGADDGTPDYLWNGGWINWGTADGFRHREFIAASPLTSMPRAAGQYTRVGYSLPPGIEIEITELVREA